MLPERTGDLSRGDRDGGMMEGGRKQDWGVMCSGPAPGGDPEE